MVQAVGPELARGWRAACRIMISGCSGGGKSTLLAELARRGFGVVAEPGRRILARGGAGGAKGLPWSDAADFGRQALAMSIADHEAARGLTFFDRGVVDAGVAIRVGGGEAPAAVLTHRYDALFLAPPWPAIYVRDAHRRHGLGKALRDYERVRLAYEEAGYEPTLLPLDTVPARADFVLGRLPDGPS